MKCTICGKEIEDHGIRFCRSCRKREHRKKYNRNHDQKPEAGYHSLAVAIVRQACKDWNTERLRADCEKFFKSKRGYTLSGVPGDNIIKVLERHSVRKNKGASRQTEVAGADREKTGETANG